MKRCVLGLLATISALTLLVATGVSGAPQLGESIPDFTLPDHLGKEHSFSEWSDRPYVVVAFLGTECPLARLYAPRLQKLADEYADRGVAFIGVNSNRQDSLTKLAAYVRQHEVKFPMLKDRGSRVADLFGAERTPQVFLLDSDRVVRYAGRIDDQYVIGVVRNKPTNEDLRQALDELLAGEEVSTPHTDPIGCIIGRPRAPQANSEVTFTRDIAPILQANCVECHRAGEIGPFELKQYDEVAGWGEMIAEVVRDNRMPPWHASPEHGNFANERRLSEQDKQLIFTWVENGCPEGDPADLPAERTFTSGWQLPREPDMVISMPEPFQIPADAGKEGIPYQYIRVPTNFTEDKWVSGMEVQPGNRAVVHHTIVYAEPAEGGRRSWIFLAAYVPGLRLDPMPPGTAKQIPAGSSIVFEQHYTPNGSKQTDVTSIGLIFADPADITSELVTTEIGNNQFSIPPHARAHEVTATSKTFPHPLTLISLSPHMHLRGKAFRYDLILPTGEREILLDVPSYDFNWQTRYVLAEPREIPAGSVIHCRAVFDNSADNLANPAPEETVRWGDQSWEEMMLGFIDVQLPRDDNRRAGSKPVDTGIDLVGLFDQADVDGDGGLSREEAAGNDLLTRFFDQIDTNGDGLLQIGEVITAAHRAALNQ